MRKYTLYKVVVIALCVCYFVPETFAQKAHPYLFYTTQRVNTLKERIKTDTVLVNSWNAIKASCDNALSSDRGANMEQLSLAYLMTGDTKYASKAKDLLGAVVNKPYWDGMDDRTPRWNAGLATSHTNYIAAITFDAIYNYLSKQERKEIADKIVKLGIEPSVNDWLSKDKRIQSLNNMGHNWWSAIVFGAGNACLAVMNEVPEAKQWAELVMDASKEWFAFNGSVLENKIPNFDVDGGFYESVSYANYGISEYLLFRLAYTNAIKPIQMPYDELLQKSVDWFIQACYPRLNSSLMSLNFGDSNDFANGERPAKILMALGLGKDYYYWYIDQASRNGFREDLSVRTPMGLLYQPEKKSIPAVPPLPLGALYGTMGWGMLRNSWMPNATMLGVKSGYTWNHSHADAGSFVLYHNGENLLIDGGDVSYGNPEYSSYFVTSRAHNVMMFNDEAQDPQDQYHAVKTPGSLYHLVDGGDLKYILADATGPTSRNFLRNYRNFLWIGNVLLIIDDLHSYEAGDYNFLLHYADTAIKRGPDFDISKGKASILFRPLYPETLPTGYPHDFPEKLKYRTEYGIKDRTTNVKIPYYVLTPAEKSNRAKFVNAIILLDSSNTAVNTFTGSSGASAAAGRSNLPQIEKFEGSNYIGVRITQAGVVTNVYINLLADGRLMHRNSSIVINGYDTDAYITAISSAEQADQSNPANIRSVFVSNGSYLRKKEQFVLSSLSKVFLYANRDGNTLNVSMNGQPLINASLNMGKISQLRLNGKQDKPVYDKDGSLLLRMDQTK